MLTSEILKISPQVEMAVIPENVHKRKKTEQLKDLTSDKVRFGKRVNNNHYAPRNKYNNITSLEKDDFFVTESKSFGFLYEIERGDGTVFYASIKPSQIVATRAEYDAYWIPEIERRKVEAELRKAEEVRQAEIRERRYAVEKERKEQHEAEALGLAESVRESILALLGQRAYDKALVRNNITGSWVSVDTEYETYRVEQLGTVTIEIRDFQRLLEKALKEG
jgi:hypothetical protein